MSRFGNGLEATSQILQETLANAAKAPFYKRVWGNRWREVTHVSQLNTLPILDKRTAIEHQHQLLTGKPPMGFGVASSGTTRTDVDIPLLNVWRGHTNMPAAPTSENDDAGWVVVSVSVNHGLPGTPGPNEIFVPWMYDRNSLSMLEAVLSQRQSDGRRITALRISAGALKVFTTWLLERGKDAATFNLQSIGTNSFRVSPFWRALISQRFGGATIIDNYSLSELEPCASECVACGWHHWSWEYDESEGFREHSPTLLCEVLDLKTNQPRQKGVGKLVVSTLLSAARLMPLIRYDTGDVVERGPMCREVRARGIRFLGRLRRGLVIESDYLLAPTIIQDVLESSSETQRSEHPCVKLGIIKSHEVGLPRWTVALEKNVAMLRFEVRFDPLIHTARARELELQLGGEVLQFDAALRRLVKNKRIEFDVSAHRAQTLTPPPDKHD